jgi:superfamily II DNA or RNA helicase
MLKANKIYLNERLMVRKVDVDDGELRSHFTYDLGDSVYENFIETDDAFYVPSNSFHKFKYGSYEDNRVSKPANIAPFAGKLRWEQQEVVNKFFAKPQARSGIIQAPCGWGKTYTGCSVISRNKMTTLVLVHTKLLFRQWIEEIKKLLPGTRVGMMGDGLLDIKSVTVGIYKTVHNRLHEIKNSFSLVIVDEAHLCPAEVFSQALNGINARTKIGITATPKRKDLKHILLPDFFTPFIVAAKDPRKPYDPSVEIVNTDFKFMVIDPKRDWSRQINKLCANKDYLQYLADTAIRKIKNGRVPLILGERVAMLKTLHKLIPHSVLLIGETTEEKRKEALENVGSKYRCVLSTKLFDEGISCHRLDTLFLTCPSNNPIKLEQRIGRIVRKHPDKQTPLVVDFWVRGPIVSRQQKFRLEWYEKRGYYIL